MRSATKRSAGRSSPSSADDQPAACPMMGLEHGSTVPSKARLSRGGRGGDLGALHQLLRPDVCMRMSVPLGRRLRILQYSRTCTAALPLVPSRRHRRLVDDVGDLRCPSWSRLGTGEIRQVAGLRCLRRVPCPWRDRGPRCGSLYGLLLIPRSRPGATVRAGAPTPPAGLPGLQASLTGPSRTYTWSGTTYGRRYRRESSWFAIPLPTICPVDSSMCNFWPQR